jgi:hypothetical protein
MRSSSAKNEAVRYTVYTNQIYKFNEFQWNSGKSGYLSLAMLLLQGRKEVGRAQLCLAYWNKWTALCCLATARKGHRIELIPSPIHSKHPLSMVPMECGNSQQKTMVSYMNGGRDSTVAWHPRQGQSTRTAVFASRSSDLIRPLWPWTGALGWFGLCGSPYELGKPWTGSLVL